MSAFDFSVPNTSLSYILVFFPMMNSSFVLPFRWHLMQHRSDTFYAIPMYSKTIPTTFYISLLTWILMQQSESEISNIWGRLICYCQHKSSISLWYPICEAGIFVNFSIIGSLHSIMTYFYINKYSLLDNSILFYLL